MSKKTSKAEVKAARVDVEEGPAPFEDAPPAEGGALTVVPGSESQDLAFGHVSATAILRLLRSKGIKVKTEMVGGSIPPLFPKNPNDGDARLVRVSGMAFINKVDGKGNEFDCFVVDVIDPASLTILGTAQQQMVTAFEDYFGTHAFEKGADGKCKTCAHTEDGWKDGHPQGSEDRDKGGVLMITYLGTLQGKGTRSGMQLWRIDSMEGLTVRE